MKSICIIFLLAAVTCFGNGVATYQQRITSAISLALNRYQQDHPESPIPELIELGGKYLDIERLNIELKSPLTNHFWLLKANSFPAPDPTKGQVVAVMTSITYDDRFGTNAVRRIVCRSSDGIFRAETASEASLRSGAQKMGFELPVFGTIQERIPDSEDKNVTNTPTLTGQASELSPTIATPKGTQPEVLLNKTPDHVSLKNEQLNASNTVPVMVGTATPVSGTSWLGVAVVLGMGFFVAAFLLIRAKQK